MAKPAKTFTSADARPRVHMRLNGDQPQVAAIWGGPWLDVADAIEGIDRIAGEGAWKGQAVIMWYGQEGIRG